MVTKYRRIYKGGIAGNGSFILAPPKGMKYKIVYGAVRLNCDSTVANRTINFVIENINATTDFFKMWNANAITASQDKVMAFGPFTADSEGVDIGWGGLSHCWIGIGDGIPIYNGDQLYLWVTNGQAGDQATIHMRILEAPEDEDFHP